MGIRTSPPSPRISFFSQIALLYSQILLLVVIPGVLVFHYAWAHGRSYGLFVLTYFPESSFFRPVPCAQASVVRLEANKKWYLNLGGQFKSGQRKWPGTVRSCTRS
jgi:hypothetical protein